MYKYSSLMLIHGSVVTKMKTMKIVNAIKQIRKINTSNVKSHTPTATPTQMPTPTRTAKPTLKLKSNVKVYVSK